ncbi:MFS transporter (plasmid) [Burkholderia sp. SFA1]|nr:MFS transporter [Burkholderia sp. SFA1]
MNTSTEYPSRTAWRVSALLTSLALINFIDKISLGMVAVPLMDELKLTSAQFGVLAGSIFWLFSLSSIVVGFFANRFQTRWILLVMAASWALLQLPLVYATAPLTILVCRVLLGAAEGPSAPLSMHELFKWFPDAKRGLPVAILNQGAVIGLIIAGLIIPVVSRNWGWRMNFVLLAVIGAVWCVLWLIFAERRDPPAFAAPAHMISRTDAAHQTLLPYRKLLLSPPVLIVILLGFSAYWSSGLMLTWLPAYLEKGYGFDHVTAGRIFALVILFTMPYTLFLSWYSQRLQARGASSRQARVQIINGAFITGGVLLLLQHFVAMPAGLKLTLFAVGNGLATICFALAPAILGELAHERQRTALLSVYAALVTSAGAIAPAVAGRFIQANGGNNIAGYETAFVIGAGLLLLSAALSMRYLHPERARERLSALGVSRSV